MQMSTNKPVFQMLVGLPGSGKSTYAAEQYLKTGIKVFSSDEVRAVYFGDINDQGNNDKVFQILHRQIKDCLRRGESAIYDATNISSKRRRAFLAEIKNIPCEKHCIVFRTSYEQCLRRNGVRERNVPLESVRRMYMNWNTPYYFEGWDEIFIYDNAKDFHELCQRRPSDFIKEKVMFDQKSPHHTLTLGNHCAQVGNLLKDDYILKYAGMLHDCGKPFCKTYKDSKGVIGKNAHYYSHENVGAYEALFYCLPGNTTLEISTLINLHMRPYQWEMDAAHGNKNREKCRRIWGDDIFAKVMRLHEADKMAH